MRGRRKFEFTPKYMLIIFIVICVLLLGGSAFLGTEGNPVSKVFSVFVVPAQKGVNGAGNWITEKLKAFENIKELQKQNEELNDKINELTMQNRALLQDRYELERLREMYELSERYSDYPTVGARIIGKGAGNWFNVFLIDKGEEEGIQVDMNVIADGGLVGIVTEVGDGWSKVKSIIDDSSSVSAMILTTQDTCIVKGNQKNIVEDYIDVAYISKDAEIEDDLEVVTSNISSKYLEGIAIGFISDVKLDETRLTQVGKLTPIVDFTHLQEVLIITQLKDVPDISEE